jgi:flagellar basal body-associated protein FliL
MFKKAQGMSINTIIIAIIVLVVLVVLVMIFTGYFGGWTGRVADCQSQGGTCGGSGSGTKFCLNSGATVDSAGKYAITDYAMPLGGKCSGATATNPEVCCPPGATPAASQLI